MPASRMRFTSSTPRKSPPKKTNNGSSPRPGEGIAICKSNSTRSPRFKCPLTGRRRCGIGRSSSAPAPRVWSPATSSQNRAIGRWYWSEAERCGNGFTMCTGSTTGGAFDLVESNYLFGEGGAGTFSDGKLTCRGSGPDVRRVLELFAACKGKPSILYDYRPHLGSNRLPAVVKAMRQRIEGAFPRRRGALHVPSRGSRS